MKDTFDGRQPLMEDDLWWKMTLDERQPLMEDKLRWKTTFDVRRPLIKDDFWWQTILFRQNLMKKTLIEDISRLRSAIPLWGNFSFNPSSKFWWDIDWPTLAPDKVDHLTLFPILLFYYSYNRVTWFLAKKRIWNFSGEPTLRAP